MAWLVGSDPAVRRILVESHLRHGQDFTPDFPLSRWIVSSKPDTLPNILLVLLLYLDSVD